MAQLKTRPGDGDVEAFLAGIEPPNRREDCRTVVALMREVTDEAPVMWGDGIVGFGRYHYVYESGREGDWFLTGVSPRKRALTVYIMAGFDGYEELLAGLGRHTTGVSCLYVKRLDEIDLDVLRELIERSVAEVRERYR
jgi:hypothetical protein